MTSFLKQLQDIAISRVKNTLFLTFLIAWMTVNYDFTLTLLFSNIGIEEKIKYIKLFPFSIDKSLWHPICITLFYQLILPLLNLGLTRLKDATVNDWIANHKNNTLKNDYIKKRNVEIEKVKTDNIAREYEMKYKKEENKLEKERVDLQEFKEFQKYKKESQYPSEDLTQEEVNDAVGLGNTSKNEELTLLQESKVLLKTASLDSDGIIFYHHFIGGVKLQSNNVNFIESGESREVAKWEAALNELKNKELIKEESEKGELFKITSLGYQIADKIEL